MAAKTKAAKTASRWKWTGPASPERISAWMRAEPELALRYVAHAWYQAVTLDKPGGAWERPAMADILTALAAASEAELLGRNGPREWARRWHRAHDNQGMVVQRAVDRSTADAGRELVAKVDAWTSKATRRVSTKALAEQATLFLILVSEPSFGRGRGAAEVIEKRIAAELSKTYRKDRVTSSMLATAILVGWGMTRVRAGYALKYA